MNMTSPNEDSGSSRPPHPALTRYYADETERRTYLRGAFDRSARHYDTINNVASFGTNDRYRLDALRRAKLVEGMKMLDVGSGTGVVAGHARDIVGPKGMVVAVDPSIGMLTEAIRRERVSLPVNGRGEYLPFADETFDFLCMSYALRHVTDLVATFREYRRVLKPGGTVLILELTPPSGRVRFHALKFYMRYIVPAVTRVRTFSKTAQDLYAYCWDSFEACVPPEEILAAMGEAGLKDASRHVGMGIFSEYTSTR